MFDLFLVFFLGASSVFSFFWFKKTNSGLKFWWLKTPTSHALLFGSIALSLKLIIKQSVYLDFLLLFSGALLILTGFGFFALVIVKSISNEKLFPKRIHWILPFFIIHGIMGIIGSYIFILSSRNINNILLTLLVLLIYSYVSIFGFVKSRTLNWR